MARIIYFKDVIDACKKVPKLASWVEQYKNKLHEIGINKKFNSKKEFEIFFKQQAYAEGYGSLRTLFMFNYVMRIYESNRRRRRVLQPLSQ